MYLHRPNFRPDEMVWIIQTSIKAGATWTVREGRFVRSTIKDTRFCAKEMDIRSRNSRTRTPWTKPNSWTLKPRIPVLPNVENGETVFRCFYYLFIVMRRMAGLLTKGECSYMVTCPYLTRVQQSTAFAWQRSGHSTHLLSSTRLWAHWGRHRTCENKPPVVAVLYLKVVNRFVHVRKDSVSLVKNNMYSVDITGCF